MRAKRMMKAVYMAMLTGKLEPSGLLKVEEKSRRDASVVKDINILALEAIKESQVTSLVQMRELRGEV